MRLEVGGHTVIEEPTDEAIVEVLTRLPGGCDSFAILSAGEQFYMQTSGSARDGFYVEYREGGEEQHFFGFRDAISLADTIDLFCRYARLEPNWNNEHQWKPMFREIPASTEPLDSYHFTAEKLPDVPDDPVVGMPYKRAIVINRRLVCFVSGVLCLLTGCAAAFFGNVGGLGLGLVFAGSTLLYYSRRSKAEKKGYNF